MKIKEWNKQTAGQMSREVERELAGLAEKYGISIKRGRGTFDPEGTFTMKLDLSLISESGEVITPEMRDFQQYCGWEGLEPEHLGKEFVSRGVTYALCGMKTRSQKYPLLAKSASGTVYKFTGKAVRRALGIEGFWKDEKGIA